MLLSQVMNNSPPRPLLRERTTYEPVYRHEEFIVPLLKCAIEEALLKHCSPRATGATVIDIGCGRQPFRALLEQLGYTYLSMDTQQDEARHVDFVAAIDEQLPAELIRHKPFD